MKELIKRTKILWLFIVAISVVGCENDDDANLPELIASFAHTINEDTGAVSFLNLSENADTYTWDFGDGNTSTEINPIRSFPTGTYSVKLTAKNAAGASGTFEDELVINIPLPINIPVTFDDPNVNYEVTTFNGASFAIVDNPDASGSNTSTSKVGAITNSGAAFEGIFFNLGMPLDLATQKSVKANFWSDAPVDVLLKLEGGTSADIEATTSHGGTGWEMITFNFSSDASYPTITLFVDGPGTTAGTFYFDDIEQIETPAATSGCIGTPIAATALPLDFEGCATFPSADNFGAGITSELSVNPSKTGINTSDFVLKVDKPTGSDFFAGIQNTFATNFDLTTTNVFKVKVYSTKANAIFRFELALNPQSDPVTGNPAPVFVTVPNANEWTEVEVLFTGLPGGPTAYNQLVIKPDNDQSDSPITEGGTYYIDDLTLDAAGGGGTCTDTVLQLPMDFDCSTITYDFVTFNGASYSVIDNPQLSGANNVASKVGEIVNIGGAFEGGAFTLGTPVDFSTDKSIKLKLYSTVAIPILLKFEGAGAPIETSVDHGGTGWEELTFDFTSSDSFNVLVLFIDGPGTTAGTFYIDDIEQVATTGGTTCTDTVLQLPMDFDCSTITYDFATFNGASYSLIDNPQLSGANNVASKVGEIVNIGGAFEGGAFTLGTPVDFSTDKSIKLKLYSTVAIPILLKFEGAGAPIETSVDHGGTGWEELTFDFTSSDSFNVLVLFIDGPGTTAGTFYIDDIEQVATTGGTTCTDTVLQLPMDFDCSTITYDFATFNGASYSLIDNPQLSGANNVASKVGEIVNIGGAFEGGAFTLGTPVDFSTDKSIKLKLYSTVAIPILLKFEGAGAPIETSVDHGGTGWEELTFDFTSSDSFNVLVLFIDGPGTTAGTFYIDDIEQVATTGGGGSNPFVNGDFETGDETGWMLFQNGGTAALDNTINNGGAWSGKLATGGPSNPAFKQERILDGTVAAGDVVQISFDHIGSVVQPGAVFNVLLFGEGAAGASFTHVFNPGPTLGSSWTTFTGTFTIPGGTDVSEGISFLIEAVCGGDAGCSVSANIDNVSITLNP